jgi:4-hydroxybenzoate polyprenyltransferase
MKPFVRALRLERWPRSTAIVLGTGTFFFLYRDYLGWFTPGSLLARAGAAFLLTWMISTANYVVNEIVDVPYDRHHPTKRQRPLVTGEVRMAPLAFAGLLLTGASLTAAWLFFPAPFFFSLLALLIAGFIYNLRPVRTKDIPFLDSISESVNNPIRLLIGWYAFSPAELRPPVSLLVGWWAFGNFLMVAKRLSEFRYLKDKAGDYRASHKKYSQSLLVFGMAASTFIFSAAYIYFTVRFKLQLFLVAGLFLALFFFLIFRKTLTEKEVMEEPEKLLVRPVYALYTAFLFLLFLLAFFLDQIGR